VKDRTIAWCLKQKRGIRIIQPSENPNLSRKDFIKLLKSIGGDVITVDEKLGKFTIVVNPNKAERKPQTEHSERVHGVNLWNS
jgi:hypothetical protein